jgi:GAF domain-containing protein
MRDQTPDAAETRLNRLLNLILETAVDVLTFDAATVTVRHSDQGLATIAATDQRLVELDDAQYESRQGPCLAVLEAGEPIYLEDASKEDDRWQHFTRTAAQLGVHSTLSVHVPTDAGEVAASLNLYARRRLELAGLQMSAAESFAQQLAAAIQSVEAYRSTAKLARELAEAMRSRAVIEQAKGILMAEQHIGAEEAFDRLAALSQQANVKLREVAARLVADRSGSPG